MAPEREGKQRKATKSDAPKSTAEKAKTKLSTAADDNEAEPSAKASRKRAADFFDDGDNGTTTTGEGKPGKSKKKAKTSTQPSKVDGHPIEVTKTHPGGDMVEMEPAEAEKEKAKSKKITTGSQSAGAGETERTPKKVGRPRKTDKGDKTEQEVDKPKKKVGRPPKQEKDSTLETAAKLDDTVAAEEAHSSKGKAVKTKSKEKEAVRNVESSDAKASDEVAEPAGKEAKSKTAKKTKDAKAAPESAREAKLDNGADVAPKDSAAPAKGRKKKKSEEAKPTGPTNMESPETTESKTPQEPTVKGLKAKKSKKSKDAEEAQAGAHAEASISKKRKAPIEEKPNLVDQLSGAATKKKARVQKDVVDIASSASKKAKELLTSGLEAATQGVNAAKDYLSELAHTAQQSVMGEVTELAAEVAEEKKKDDEAEQVPSNLREAEEEEEEEEFEEDDQTAALLKGFESSGEEDVDGDEGFTAGEVPKLPNKKGLAGKLKKIKPEGQEPGVVYVGRIPHGFYEHEMRSYFEQFGSVHRLRLSRNRATGKSKHYAFIEFASSDVAKIVADTMNSYLMFGHILKCSVVPKEQVHENLWKGANKRFKTVPRNKIEGRKLAMPKGKSTWEKKVESEKKKRAEKSEKLKNKLGYEFEGPELKGIDTIFPKDGIKAITDAAGLSEVVEQEKTVVVENNENEGTLTVSEEVKAKRVKKPSKKTKEDPKSDTEAVTDQTAAIADSTNAVLEVTAKVIEKIVATATDAGNLLAATSKDSTAVEGEPDASKKPEKKKRASKKEKTAATEVSGSVANAIAKPVKKAKAKATAQT